MNATKSVKRVGDMMAALEAQRASGKRGAYIVTLRKSFYGEYETSKSFHASFETEAEARAVYEMSGGPKTIDVRLWLTWKKKDEFDGGFRNLAYRRGGQK